MQFLNSHSHYRASLSLARIISYSLSNVCEMVNPGIKGKKNKRHFAIAKSDYIIHDRRCRAASIPFSCPVPFRPLSIHNLLFRRLFPYRVSPYIQRPLTHKLDHGRKTMRRYILPYSEFVKHGLHCICFVYASAKYATWLSPNYSWN